MWQIALDTPVTQNIVKNNQRIQAIIVRGNKAILRIIDGDLQGKNFSRNGNSQMVLNSQGVADAVAALKVAVRTELMLELQEPLRKGMINDYCFWST